MYSETKLKTFPCLHISPEDYPSLICDATYSADQVLTFRMKSLPPPGKTETEIFPEMPLTV
jgi:hypothetical protein